MAACFNLDGFSGGNDASAPGSDGGKTPEAAILPVADAMPGVDAGPSCGVAGPSDGLIAYYPFDETDGATSADCSGHGLTGTFVSTSPDGGSRVPGVHGGAIQVVSAYKTGCVDLGLAPSLATEPFTAAVWLRVDSFPNTPSTQATGYVLGQTVNANFGGWRFGSEGNEPSGNVIQWEQGVPDGSTASTSAVWPSDGGWHHFAITVEPTAINVYVDGVVAAPAGTSFPLDFSTVAARIGCREDNGNYYDGLIDELRFYGRVLTAAEIAGLATR